MRPRIACASIVLGLFVCLDCGCGGANGETPAFSELESDPPLDEAGWPRALDAARRSWGDRPASSTLLAVVRDELVAGVLRCRFLRAIVTIDGVPVKNDDDEAAIAIEVTPGRHSIVVEGRVWGPPCISCSGPGSFVAPARAFDVDVAAATAVVFRVAVRAHARVCAPPEARLLVVGEARAWHRSQFAGSTGAIVQ